MDDPRRSSPSGILETTLVRAETASVLLCRIGHSICALPVADVVETMRPLPIRPLTEMPAGVLGLTVIRGVPVPVVDGRALVSGDSQRGGHETIASRPGRFAVIKAGARWVALAVEEIAGVRELAAATLADLPLLVRQAHPDAIAAIGILDVELLLVLRAARILPESVWDGLRARGALS